MNKRRTNKLRIFLFCVLLTSSFLTKAAVIYVNPAAVGANNGTSWANAYTSLSSALLAAVSGDEIWVKQGVYKPTTLVDVNGAGGAEAREATFQIPDGVALYGGFAGTEASRDERNWEANVTILSGDIDNNDLNVDGNSIAEVVTNIVGNNAYHVVHTSNVNTATTLDGFIVTAGRANAAGNFSEFNRFGGGWFNKLSGGINASSPTIRNTTFQGNFCSYQGAAFSSNEAAAGGAVLSVIENSKFINNESGENGGAISGGSYGAGNYQLHIISSEFISNVALRRGGALYLVGDHATIDSTYFTDNSVTVISPDGGTLPGSGGAFLGVASNAVFNYCIFKSNSATGNPTGSYEGGGGGAVYVTTSKDQTQTLGIAEPRFFSCGFYNNDASGNTHAWGGAAVMKNDGGKLRPHFVNCVFSANTTSDNGGAIYNVTRVTYLPDPAFTPDLTPTVTNCTFVANHAGNSGGAIYNWGFTHGGAQVLNMKLVNSILWNDSATGSNPEVANASSAINQVSYSLIQGSGGSGGGWVATIGTDAGNNKDTNPGFTSSGDPDGADNIPATNDDGLTLITTSAAADAGNNAAPGLVGITTDYRLASRFQGTVDMGAYERAGIVIPDLPIYWLYEWRPFPPICLSCPWSFLLLDQTLQSYIWDGPAQLVEEKEYAYVKGHIVNPKNKKQGFDVYLKLVNKQNWASWSAKGRTYMAISPEAVATAKLTHTRWTFWELSSESYLKGTGDFVGTLKLTHFPTNYKVGFQLGAGANGWDKDLGLGGSFSYKGTILKGGKKLNLSGTGSMNVDAVKCQKGCTPAGESLRIAQDVEESKEPLSLVSKEISVYPVPARTQLTILSENLDAGKYSVKFYNNKGVLKKQGTLDTDNGNLTLGVEDLETGIYVLKVISSTGETLSKKLIIE